MRALLTLFIACLLCGCFSPAEPQSISYVRLYQNSGELIGVNYREIGKASGLSCQTLQQDRPATIFDARTDLQRHAARIGDAVVLDKCEMLNGFMGCYRAAVCEGTVIKFVD